MRTATDTMKRGETLGLLAEKQFRRARLFVNGENLTGVRGGIRSISPHALRTVAGPSMPGPRSKAGTSTPAFASDFEPLWRLAGKPYDDQCASDGQAGTDDVSSARPLLLGDP
jgi:hypothetical protein